MKKVATVAQRLLATFVVHAMAIIAGASLLGGISVWKSACLAGVSSIITIVEKLARASMDGILTYDEINDAFSDSAKK